jgi:TPR repeat protein
MLACSLGLLFPPLYGCGFADFIDQGDFRTPILSAQVPQREAAEMVKLANAIRTQSTTDEDHIEAVELYLKAAKQNHAEAQYWLSIMYLKGMGITEDDDKALHWVSAASDQNYPPAKELLHHLLTYDEALDC